MLTLLFIKRDNPFRQCRMAPIAGDESTKRLQKARKEILPCVESKAHNPSYSDQRARVVRRSGSRADKCTMPFSLVFCVCQNEELRSDLD
jgi:hypothetical protein